MNRMPLATLWTAFMYLTVPQNAAAEPNPCDPDVLQQKMEACGLDVTCINQAMAQFNSSCAGNDDEDDEDGGSTGAVTSVSGLESLGNLDLMGGMTGAGDAIRKMQACGGDEECSKRVMDELRGGDQADEDTAKRLSERTVLPASWLQSYQEALVACEKDQGCWGTMMGIALAYIRSTCGTNMFSEAVMICNLAAQYEMHIEQAVAMQRLWRKGIRFEDDAPGVTNPESDPSDIPAASGDQGDSLPGQSAGVLTFLPKVTESKVRNLLSSLEAELERKIPADARERIKESANQYPLTADGLPPLVYEEVSTPSGIQVQTKPSRRDWYYALSALLLTQVGLSEEGEKRQQVFDTALWCLIQAAKLNSEAEHYSNIGFHLNLRGEVEKARDVLSFARTLDDSLADAYNNLAFSYSAMGKQEEALALQRNAARLAPEDAHIRSRLATMEGAEGGANSSPMPYGGDFGEAFFRFGKRHHLREWGAGRAWFQARENAKTSIFGGDIEIPGPYSWYKEQMSDIETEYSGCVASAPDVARGCPFGPGIIHPDCANAASPEEVARTQHNRNVHLCECAANALMAKADALSAYLDRSIAAWRGHEEAWLPRLQYYLIAWRPEIEALNKRYVGTGFEFPVESGFSYWPEEYNEDSDEAWDENLPEIFQKWYELKTQVQNLKECGTRLPPPPEKPKRPRASPPERSKSYSISLFLVQFNLGMDGSYKLGFDLGFVKGSYERMSGSKGYKVEVGSGPVEFSYQSNPSPGAGGDSSRVAVTVTANFLKFIPGAGSVGGEIADQFFSFGSKFEVGWGNRTGIAGNTTVENKSKFGFSSRDVSVAPATSMKN